MSKRRRRATATVSEPPAGAPAGPRTLTPPPVAAERTLTPGQWGIVGFLLSEVAFFCTLIAAYVMFIGKDRSGPTPAEVLHLPLVLGTTACLLASSFAVHRAEGAHDRQRGNEFARWWLLAIGLGIAFLAGTAYEWQHLIMHAGLTIDRNLFGTTFYTLVGFHGLHVTGGVVAMLVVFVLYARRAMQSPQNAEHGAGPTSSPEPAASSTAASPSPAAAGPSRGPGHGGAVQLVSWYWHFVDAVWIVVFLVVYV